MPAGFLSPIGLILQAFSDQGVVGAGYKVYIYTAGSSAPATTYTDSTLTVQNANPIVLGPNGRLPSVSVWAPSGTVLKMVLTDTTDAPLTGGTIDNIPLLNDVLSSIFPRTAQEIAAGVTPTDYGYPVGNALRYGADPSGATSSATALQNAINANVGGQVVIPQGTYALGATGLTLPQSGIRITGNSRNGVIITYTGTGVAIDGYTNSASNTVLEHFTLQCSANAATGIKLGNGVQHIDLTDVYVQGNGGASNTGAGIELNSGNPSAFSGNLTGYLVYCLGFKFGIKVVGHDTALNTWTSFSFFQTYLVGRASGIISGSKGLWLDANTNGVGSSFEGGTVEGFDVGVAIDAGSYGLEFFADNEGNNTAYSVGNTFTGRYKENSAVGEFYEAVANGASNFWYRRRQKQGVGFNEEYYYAPEFVQYDAAGSAQFWGIKRGASKIDGGTPLLKFGAVISSSTDHNGPNHCIILDQQSIHWDTQSPQVTGSGRPDGSDWAKGDVCFNSNAAVGSPKGWTCTVAGTPGTWVSQGNL